MLNLCKQKSPQIPAGIFLFYLDVMLTTVLYALFAFVLLCTANTL